MILKPIVYLSEFLSREIDEIIVLVCSSRLFFEMNLV